MDFDFGSEEFNQNPKIKATVNKGGDGDKLLDFEIDSKLIGDGTGTHEKKQSAGSDRDFEHVDKAHDYLTDHYNTISSAAAQKANSAASAANDFMSDIGKDIGNEFSQFQQKGEDLLSDFGSNITGKTRDFMAAERGFNDFKQTAPSQPAPIVAPPSQHPLNPGFIEEKKSESKFFDDDDDDDDKFDNDSYNPSPIKKQIKVEEQNEKFISSEDLLGGDFNRTATPELIKQPAAGSGLLSDIASGVQNLLDDEFGIKGEDIRSTIPISKIEAVKEPTEPFIEMKKEIIEPEKSREKAKPIAEKPKMIQAEEMFYKFGLDTWFKPDRLHPKVESLIYWRDVKKSGIVFGAGLITLLAISCFSVISVIAYLSLITLAGTIAFRIYKNVLGAVQKTSEGHPFKEYLEMDLNLSQDKVQQICNVAVAHINAFFTELRRLFLVEDLVDSLKFGVILWVLTYIGSWFNGMTLVILAFISLFSLPKVYEQNKQIIDQNLDIVRSKFLEITDKVKAAIPIGKKPAESEKDK